MHWRLEHYNALTTAPSARGAADKHTFETRRNAWPRSGSVVQARTGQRPALRAVTHKGQTDTRQRKKARRTRKLCIAALTPATRRGPNGRLKDQTGRHRSAVARKVTWCGRTSCCGEGRCVCVFCCGESWCARTSCCEVEPARRRAECRPQDSEPTVDKRGCMAPIPTVQNPSYAVHRENHPLHPES